MVVGDDLADAHGVAPQRMGAHRRQYALGIGRGTDRDQLALVGNIQRIEAEELAGGGHHGLHRNRLLVEHHADAGVAGDFVQRRRQAAARRVAQAAQAGAGGQHRGDQAVERRRV